jgi:serine/threonine-protein kinase
MLSPGTMLGGRYRLDERIAGGGMGDVWRATDEVLGRTVAVKTLLPALLEEPGFAERFRGEARTMATINHPGVVDVYDYGSENGTAFLVMEYVEGDALSRTLGRVGRLTPARTMALLAQAADALHAAHVNGIVHRDVKPGNLLVRPNGTLVLTDFGIARSAAVGQLTAAGTVLGTASYISPEQAAGQGATALSDVYALGVVAYQCLSGHRPFEGENPLEIAMRHVRDNPPPLPGDIPPTVRQIVERAMAKDPAARWPTAAVLGQVARRAAAQLSGTGMHPSAPPPAAARPTGPVPVSGAPGTPTSGAPTPGAPSSGAPSSGAPRSGPPVSGGPTNLPRSPLAAAAGPSAPPGPGAPVAAGPGAPVPAGPGAPPTGPMAPGGTRIMPGGPVPVAAASGSPADPPPPGAFARGAAGVPPPPPVADTANTYAASGGRFPTGPHRPPVPTPARPGGGNRNRIILYATLAVVLVVAVCGGGTWFLLTRNGGKAAPQPTTATTVAPQPPGPAPTTAAEGVTIPCDELKGQDFATVDRLLRRNRFAVKRVDQPGGTPEQVVDVEPCQAPRGSQITVTVSTGRGPDESAEPTSTCLGGGLLGTCLPTGRS